MTDISSFSDFPEVVRRSNIPEAITRQSRYGALQPVAPGKVVCDSAQETWGWTHALNEHKWPQEKQQHDGLGPESSRMPRKICNLRPRTFWCILGVVCFVILGCIIAGMTVDVLSTKNKSSSRSSAAPTSIRLSPSSVVSRSAVLSSHRRSDPASPSSASSSQEAISSTATPTSSSSPIAPSQEPVTSPATPTLNSNSITTTEVIGPSATLYRDCPSANNTIYTFGFSGTPMYFRQYCETAFQRASTDVIAQGGASSLAACIDLCGAYNIANEAQIAAGAKMVCSAVNWRNTFESSFPGHCFGFPISNTTDGEFRTMSSTNCDSAGWINPDF